MSFKIGIVGLPNVGKSTLFQAITKKQVEAENYPFCTISPNAGTVEVPDKRIEDLAKISKSKKTVFTTIEFVDIAGLVRGAHEGKGLGNKFLSHIREVDAIIEVLRDFEDKNIVHTEGEVNLKRDKDIIDMELIISDIQLIEKVFQKLEKEVRSGDKEIEKKFQALKKAKKVLEEENFLHNTSFTLEEGKFLEEFNFLTQKPVIYLKNINEKGSGKEDGYLLINAKLEAELASFSEKEADHYLRSFGIKESGLEKLVKESYRALDLISFFTSGEKETKAWTVEKGSSAPIAAGKIHSDFQRNFIRVEVVSWKDFIQFNGWSGAREVGKVKEKGRDYIVEDGDVLYFKVGK